MDTSARLAGGGWLRSRRQGGIVAAVNPQFWSCSIAEKIVSDSCDALRMHSFRAQRELWKARPLLGSVRVAPPAISR